MATPCMRPETLELKMPAARRRPAAAPAARRRAAAKGQPRRSAVGVLHDPVDPIGVLHDPLPPNVRSRWEVFAYCDVCGFDRTQYFDSLLHALWYIHRVVLERLHIREFFPGTHHLVFRLQYEERTEDGRWAPPGLWP